jgi:hypothetical protein
MTININSIKSLEKTIRSHTDCQSLLFAIEVIINQQIEQLDSVVQMSGDLSDLFSPLTKLPTSIDDIIKIFKDSISKQAFRQLEASIEQAKQIIEYAAALGDLVSAIEDASVRYSECFAQAPGALTQSIKQKIDNKVDDLIGPALQKVRSAAELINNTIPNSINIDTSSAEAFSESVRTSSINKEFVISEYDRIFKN